MDLGTFQQHLLQELAPLYGKQEASALFRMIAGDILGYRPHEIVMHRNDILPADQLDRLQEVVVRLQKHEPVQYILGRAWFNGMQFQVSRDTLIPRQETEELVAWVVSDGIRDGVKILDIGTGSGCIAVALAKAFGKTRVDAVDVSPGALEVAGANALEQGVKVRFLLQDILKLKTLSALDVEDRNEPYEVIVSNPPYVRDLEKKEMQANVLEFEPASALFVTDQDPLVFYRKIGLLAFENLGAGGRLYFEINQYLGPETLSLLKEIGFTEVELKKDLLGNYRMIKAVK